MSENIASDVIAELGELHHGRKQVQPAGWVVQDFRERAKEVLKFPIQKFSREDMDIIASSFAECIQKQTYTCYACAIMPDHIHLLIRKHKKQAEEMIEDIQAVSRLRHRNSERRTFAKPQAAGDER
jgi:hypothetical protein